MRRQTSRYLLITIVIIAIIVIAGSALSQLRSTSSPLIDKPIAGDVYNQLVEISNQGYNITALPTNDFKVLPLNFSSNGKPAIIYVGAEWCPYCGAERWALIIALLRFGNFSNLEYMVSSPTDVYPNTPTFTFANSTYNSPYISFYGIEYQDRNYQPLDKVPTPIYNMWENYGNLSIPFLIIGYYYKVGTSIDPGLLSGHNWTYVLDQLHNPNSLVYKEIYSEANLITQMICKVDGYKPYNVCSHFMQASVNSDSSLFYVSTSLRINSGDDL
ncbi:DUF929 domain-containing protein [Saccharolobus solfataricus]|uniref:DUF929 domain-containing protein n=3 Tax=Saccharolobus solfataricus TaxID=2287 RepID=Q97X81_SACS2|nr:DUF929 domain-containing protein [Saccharolobus solfataricus]AAK42061.1 Hypothetical protein SSO1873 [Saccharolobus solfataricus P2]AKA74766.1 DUF929 domain-containing protein [Saccharolobus solfataricus]AKA77462.1 DUF929 domain-containing protein [Saccharolobus solfataricus]AKA80152.1 DUF929 domain-containing protein [Saccharolobus solfataricus]AZF69232.1 DUF929 domain-containing protein [Saccharolobus solfataricus]